jgi:hypothetical protein
VKIKRIAALLALAVTMPLAALSSPVAPVSEAHAASDTHRFFVRADSDYASNFYTDANCSVGRVVVKPGGYSPQGYHSTKLQAIFRMELPSSGTHWVPDNPYGWYGKNPYGPLGGCYHILAYSGTSTQLNRVAV